MLAVPAELVSVSLAYVRVYFGGMAVSMVYNIGAGETVRPMVITLLCTCLFRVLWIALISPARPGMELIIGSYPASWLLASVRFIIYYHRRRCRLR